MSSYAEEKAKKFAAEVRSQATTPAAKENVEFAKTAVVEARKRNEHLRSVLLQRQQGMGMKL